MPESNVASTYLSLNVHIVFLPKTEPQRLKRCGAPTFMPTLAVPSKGLELVRSPSVESLIMCICSSV